MNVPAHGVRRRALFGEVHYCVGLLVLEEVHELFVVLRHVQVLERNVLAAHLLPRLHARLDALDGRQGFAAQLDVNVPAREVVHNHHLWMTYWRGTHVSKDEIELRGEKNKSQ